MLKKLVSLLLSVLLILSCCSAAFAAFAETAESEDVSVQAETAGEQKGAEIEMDAHVLALLQAYTELAKNQNEMTDEQKAKLAEYEEKLQNFGSEFAGALSSAEATAQASKILSAMTGTVAKLTGKTGPVGELEGKIDAYEGRVSTAEPSEEDLAGYNELVASYGKLTDAQKGELEVTRFDKLFHLVLDREYYVYRAEVSAETGKNPSSKDAYAAAQARAETILGNAGYVTCFAEAKALNETVNNNKLSAQERLDAFAAASENVRIYASLWYKSYTCFYYKINSSSAGKAFFTLAQAFGKEALAAEPFTEKSPAKVSRPSAKNYEGGENDPQYIADFAAYMENQKAISEYNCRKANHTAKFEMQGMETVAAAASEYKAIVDIAKDALAAMDAFAADNTNLAPAKKVAAAYEKLTDYQKAVISESTVIKVRTEPREYDSSWSTTSLYISTCCDRCKDIAQYDKLTAFIQLVNSIAEPYDNDDIAKVRESYDAVPASLRASVPEEVMEKYKAILASIAPDTPSLVKPDLSVYTETTVVYPKGATRAQVEEALPKLENAVVNSILPLLGVDGGLPNMVKTGLYTNYSVAEIAKMLYPLLGDLAGSLLNVTPEKLAKTLTEGKFAGAVAALNAAQTAGDAAVAGGAENVDYWSYFTVVNGNFGFRDGDKEGFLDAVAALFRPLSLLATALQFENNISTTNGTYTYGAYEDLMPIFEALDLEGVLSSHEYTLYVNKVKETDNNMAMDARIRPILVPILNLVDRFAEAPLDTLLDVLPKLGWALKSNLVNDQLSTLISKIKFVSVTPPDLSPAGLYDLLAGDSGEFSISLDENNAIKINKEKFVQFISDIAGCGTAVVKDSIARGTAYRLGVDSDKPDAFVVLFRWLYGELTTGKNVKAIKGAVDNFQDLNTVAKLLVKVVLNCVAETPTDTALATVVNLFAPAEPTTPDLSDIGNLIPNIGGNADNNGDANAEQNSGGQTQTDKLSNPKTGGRIMSPCFLLVTAAALAGGAILYKKKCGQD